MGSVGRALDMRSVIGLASFVSPAPSPILERRKPAVTWDSLPLASRVYVVLVTTSGGYAMAASIPNAARQDLRILALLTGLSIAASMAKVSLPVSRSGSTLTVCYVLDFTTLLVLGPYAATLTAGLGAWSQCTTRRRERTPLFHTLFSVAALALTVQASGAVYALFGGQPGLPLGTFRLEALIATSATFFMVNSSLVATAIALSTGQSPTRVWIASYLWSWPGHLVGFAIAVGAAFGIGQSRLWLVPFSLVSLALTFHNFKAYVTRFNDSLTDPLTGVYNVRHLLGNVTQEVERSRRSGSPLAVLLIDLDRFKSINDQHGHGAGDTALRQVAQCVQQSIRLYDICARYGGDEFVAVLPGCDREDAGRKAFALQRAVAGLSVQSKSNTMQLSVSVGCAVFPDDGATFEELMSIADLRMFADKEGHARHDQPPPRHSLRGDAAPRLETTDLQLQQRLMEAQRLEAVGQLAGGVAHDFNNVLTAILGYSELLTEQIGADKPIGRDLQEIVGAAQHAASLTHQLLAFSRKQTLSTAEIDVNHVVSLTDAMLGRLLGERITIVTCLGDDLHSVVANVARVEQIVVNLAVNARDAMPDGGVLTLTTTNIDVEGGALPHPNAKPGPYARLSVRDTGTGMSAEVQARIFEAFFTTKEPGKGTGLGLAAVQEAVAELGGFIRVESTVGAGSTFHVFLPSTDHPASVRILDADAVSTPSPVGDETILLVEDEAGVRQFVALALERHGYRVLEAHSAEAALKLLQGLSCPIHLVLSDVVLPGIDGCEFAARVERTHPRVPILFTTGYVDSLPHTDHDGRGLAVLEKPFSARTLLEKTRELLDRYPVD